MTQKLHKLIGIAALLFFAAPGAAHILWVPFPNMPFHVLAYGLAESYGRVYLISGWAGAYVDANQEFDPVTATWAFRASSPLRAAGTACAAVYIPAAGFQLVFVGGGGGGNGWEAQMYQYYPPTDEWARRSNHPFLGRSDAAAADLGDGKLHLLGGTRGSDRYNDHAVYDPVTFNWSSAAPMSGAAGEVSAVADNGKLRVAGGSWHALYDPATDTWLPQPAVPAAAGQVFMGVNVDGAFHVRSASGHARYDSSLGTWTLLSPHPFNVIASAATINGVPVWFGGSSGSMIFGTPMAFYESAFFLDSQAPFGGNGLPETPFRDFAQALAAFPPQPARMVMLVARPGTYAALTAYNFDRPAEIRKWGTGGNVQIGQ